MRFLRPLLDITRLNHQQNTYTGNHICQILSIKLKGVVIYTNKTNTIRNNTLEYIPWGRRGDGRGKIRGGGGGGGKCKSYLVFGKKKKQ
jgi:hypothetical protein